MSTQNNQFVFPPFPCHIPRPKDVDTQFPWQTEPWHSPSKPNSAASLPRTQHTLRTTLGQQSSTKQYYFSPDSSLQESPGVGEHYSDTGTTSQILYTEDTLLVAVIPRCKASSSKIIGSRL